MAVRRPPTGPGGVEKVVRELVEDIAIARPEWQLRVVVAFARRTLPSRVPLLGDLIAAIRIGVAPRGPWDVFVVHGAEYAWVPILLGKLQRRPVLVVWHGLRWREAQGFVSRSRVTARCQQAFFLTERWLQGLALRSDATVTVSPSVAEDIRSVYGFSGAIRVIPNGVRSPMRGAVQTSRRPICIRDNSTLPVLWVGAQRQPYGKGLDVALEACAEARQRGIGITLDVVGLDHAPPGFTIYQYAPWITWRGRLGPEDMTSRYSQAGVLLAPTRYEGFGMVVLEALASGLPVIGSPAIAWMVADAGICVDTWSPAAYASALATLWASGDLRKELQRKARARAGDFRWETAAAQYVRLIESAISEASPFERSCTGRSEQSDG